MNNIKGQSLLRILVSLLVFFNICTANNIFIPLPTEIEYDKAKVELGKKLFFDPILSKNNDISCASCHGNYGVDNEKFSIGDNQTEGFINTPTVFNLEYNLAFFWNGRSETLKEQMIDGPLFAKHEMANDKTTIENRLKQSPEYIQLFLKAYSLMPTFDNMLDAIVSFEETLITPNSKFDQYLRNEYKLTQKEENGMDLFLSYGCVSCHNGINLGGNSYQKFGTIIEYKDSSVKWADREDVTKNINDKNIFRVPSLRNIEKTAPYFHNGQIKTLQNAIYIMGYHNVGIVMAKNEVEDIEAFLKTLTGEIPKTFILDN
ncbi:MAG: cytochrome-c peroxidase [Poseidonibacter sp.]|uniref:cytochrome-c peroxidase n=1 Tax=Poseidonibacter sp. TaxID=2321188 RepID=UPI00359E2A25